MSASETTKPDAVGRRRVLGFLVGSGVMASLASFVYPILRFVLPPKTGELDSDTVAAKKDELAPNSAKIFRMGIRPGILVRLADGSYRAFGAVCTHLNCTVQYRSDLHSVWCACHNGMYTVDGGNISGPPPRPLEAYEVVLKGDEIYVRRRGNA